MIRQARTRVVGHLNYYAITDNAAQCSYYLYLRQTNPVQMAQPQEPAQQLHMGAVRLGTCPTELARRENPQRPEPVS